MAHQHESGILSAYIDDVKGHSAEQRTGLSRTHRWHYRDSAEQRTGLGAKLNMNKHRSLLESCLDATREVLLQRHFYDKFQIPLNRIHIHPDNISDSSEKASAKLHYGDIILGIPGSPFAEFIDAFVVNEVEEISAELRLASHRLKDEPHHLWYLLEHILALKFTYLFRGIPPGFSQPLATV